YHEKGNIIFSYPQNELEKALSIMLFYHDIGKGTLFFQEYLQSKRDNTPYNYDDDLRKHALISAVYAGYKAHLSIQDDICNSILPIAVFYCIRKHHGNLINLNDDIGISKPKWKIIEEQWKFLDLNSVDERNPLLFSDAKDYIDDLYWQVDDFITSIENYNLMNLFFSILTYADKNEAAFSERVETKSLNNDHCNLIENYKSKKFDTNPVSKLNVVRNSIFNDCKNAIKTGRILSVNVPTGSGKTLTVINTALKILKDDPSIKKIIYTLPFTSVIDQTQKVIREVFELSNYDADDYIIVHHHLAEAEFKLDEDFIKGDSAQFLIENWDAPIILTTFWQLFNTLLSGKNKQLRKFHNIADSIIILDEIQSVRHEYWELIKVILQNFSTQFNCMIILMTATMPLIFKEEENEILSLISKERRDGYFRKLSRYKLFSINELENISTDELYLKVKEHLLKEKQKSFLFVFNTIKSSINFFNLLKEDFMDEELIYLSTNIIPVDRIDRIEKIKNNANRKIIVSTQLIEAGVDIDLDIVYRDFAPFDSLIQTAGRCNRNNSEIKGEVYIFKLYDSEKNKNFCNFIYSTSTLHATDSIIKDCNGLPESELLSLIVLYYKKIISISSSQESIDILKYVKRLEYENIEKDFKLIEDNIPNVLIFIEKDEKATELLLEFNEIIKIEDKIERKNRFLEIKKDFYSYSISININPSNISLLNSLPEIGNYKLIDKDMLSSLYDKMIGYNGDFNNFF
ncbi:MAG: CRISPR-associated helicase Cas3', partial [Spirochaetota bacterium]|nr:CRISPR-associated helicase Cas3' [Spirochaetota bacterium]